jgi:hypothetical protein
MRNDALIAEAFAQIQIPAHLTETQLVQIEQEQRTAEA